MTRFVAAIALVCAIGIVPVTASAKRAAKTVTLPDGLKYVDQVVGSGVQPQTGQTISVHIPAG